LARETPEAVYIRTAQKEEVRVARSDIDAVVTEHGVAALRDKGLDQRADALITIADPQFRDRLAQDWRALRAAIR